MSGHLVWVLTKVVLATAAVLIVIRQCRKPGWLLGRAMTKVMNRSHAAVTAWGLGHVVVRKGATILDVGCGGGRTVHTLAEAAAEGRVFGVDYSSTSVEAARSENADLIAAGRVTVQQASVSSLPFPDATFDLVTAVETHYYWPDPVADLQEIRRVLKPGGTVILIAETYRGERFGAFLMLPMMLLRARYSTLEEHRGMLAAAGYEDVMIDHAAKRGWMCAVAHAP